MEQQVQSQYMTVLGRDPETGLSELERVVVSHVLPKIGEHGFKWVVADVIKKQYGHYSLRPHPKANPVNIHVFGDPTIIQRLAVTGKAGQFELGLIVKTTPQGRKFLLVNLYLAKPYQRETHRFAVVSAPRNHPDSVYTTNDMRGVGVKVEQVQVAVTK